MYDIEFHLAVCPSDERYLQRFLDFKKYGLTNIKDKKVKLKLLVGSEKYPSEAVKDWPVEIDVIKHNYPTPSLLPKLYDYCSNIDFNSARWYSRLDDDSITDVSGLLGNLENDFDHEREYYLISPFFGAIEDDVRNTDIKLACDFGYSHWFVGPDESYPLHEVEFCAVSQAAIRRILTTEITKNFLKERTRIWRGYGDIALAYAAKMCKIHLIVVPFITHEPSLCDFTGFSGHLVNHIHWMAYDSNHNLFDMWKRYVDKTICTDEEWQLLSDKVFSYNSKKIKFNYNGTVAGKFWYLEDDFLTLTTCDGKKCNCYFKKDELKFIHKNFVISKWEAP